VAIICLTAFSNLPRQLLSLIASAGSTAGVDAETDRTGKIVMQASSGQCKKMKFDNQNGAVTEDSSPCDDKLVFDSHGVPVPQGTVRRLDAISKSFMAK